MRYRLIIRRVATIAAATAVLLSGGAGAQTLVNPNAQPTPSRPRLAAKPRQNEHLKLCSAYGAGFVNIPGTDACIKIGASVNVDSTVNRGR
jgi:hypothetical protein